MARLTVNRAKRSRTSPSLVSKGNAEVGPDVQLWDGKVVADKRVDVASSITRGAALATTCWRNECVSGVSRSVSAHTSSPLSIISVWQRECFSRLTLTLVRFSAGCSSKERDNHRKWKTA